MGKDQDAGAHVDAEGPGLNESKGSSMMEGQGISSGSRGLGVVLGFRGTLTMILS